MRDSFAPAARRCRVSGPRNYRLSQNLHEERANDDPESCRQLQFAARCNPRGSTLCALSVTHNAIRDWAFLPMHALDSDGVVLHL
jgi:hypothetical protein